MNTEPPEEISRTKTRGRLLRSRWVWGVVILLVVAVGGKVIHRAMQPKFLDKTVAEWFAEYTIKEMTGHEVHNRPFQELGTDAAWYLWGEYTCKDSKATAWLMALKDKLTGNKRTIFGGTNEEERRTKAAHLIARLGPASEVLIPEIVARLNSTDLDEVAGATMLLGEIRRRPEVAVPALHASLLSTNWNFKHRRNQLYALGSFGGDAKAVLPELRSRLVNPAYTNNQENFYLAYTILTINGPGPELGLFTNGLVPGNYSGSSSYIHFITLTGTNARPAVPVLLEFAKTLTNQWEVDWVKIAIQMIDPEGVYPRP